MEILPSRPSKGITIEYSNYTQKDVEEYVFTNGKGPYMILLFCSAFTLLCGLIQIVLSYVDDSKFLVGDGLLHFVQSFQYLLSMISIAKYARELHSFSISLLSLVMCLAFLILFLLGSFICDALEPFLNTKQVGENGIQVDFQNFCSVSLSFIVSCCLYLYFHRKYITINAQNIDIFNERSISYEYMNGNRYGSVSIDAHEDNNSKTSQTLVIRRPSTEVQEVHFSVGSKVLAQSQHIHGGNSQLWFPATIVKVTTKERPATATSLRGRVKETTYDVRYNDGHVELNKSSWRIEMISQSDSSTKGRGRGRGTWSACDMLYSWLLLSTCHSVLTCLLAVYMLILVFHDLPDYLEITVYCIFTSVYCTIAVYSLCGSIPGFIAVAIDYIGYSDHLNVEFALFSTESVADIPMQVASSNVRHIELF